MESIRLMLVDDHQVIRTGLKTFLETQPDFKVVAEASNGQEAIARALETRPDIVLMDITMPEMDGLEATRELKKLWPECVVLSLTVHEDKFYFMEMLAAGAAGYLTKQAASDELVQAIHTVAQGHVYLQPALARWLIEDYQRLASEKPSQTESGEAVGLDVLSQREREVLELVAQGLNNAEIGAKLELSPKTVARHRERIMKRLSLHSRTELVKFAIKTGLVKLQ
ncbi:MAG: DNA-binding response regulator [Chloroflexi bacterium HGW-Chloroflexi-6]|nr:MAG: DNA-binding response regulator [Chloroflexi bacterium HGW-Chloroflexi-6]